MYDGVYGLKQLPSAVYHMEPYFELYSSAVNGVGLLTAPLMFFTFLILLRSRNSILPTYKRLLLVILFWFSVALFVFVGISKTVVVLPCTVIINIGWTANLGPEWTTAVFALGNWALFLAAQSIYNSFIFNYFVVCHPALREYVVSLRIFVLVYAFEACITACVIAIGIAIMPVDISATLVKMDASELMDKYAPVAEQLPVVVCRVPLHACIACCSWLHWRLFVLLHCRLPGLAHLPHSSSSRLRKSNAFPCSERQTQLSFRNI